MTKDEALSARRALATMFAANGMVIGAWAPQIPLLLPRHGIEEGAFGTLILVLGIGAICAMLVSGRALARFGSLPLLRLSALCMLPTLPLIILAPDLPLLGLAMFLFGALIGFMDVIMNANAVEVERRLGRAIMSSSHGFWSLGGFVGGTLGSWLIGQGSPILQACCVMAMAGAMVLIAWRWLRGEPPHPVTKDPTAPRHALVPKDLRIWLLGGMALISMVPEGSVLDWAALYLRQELAAEEMAAGLGFALFAGAMALVRFVGDALRNRFGAVKTFRVSGVTAATGLMLAAVAPSAPVALAGFAMAGLGIANLVPILFSAAGNFPGHSSGAALAAVTMVGYAGILIAPASIGFVAQHWGFRSTYAALALLLLIVSLLGQRTALADARQEL